jgi:phage tail-like protein
MDPSVGYLHLNAANEWPLFDLHGLEVDGTGALRLEEGSPTGYQARGLWRAGPFQVSGAATDWYRLTVQAAPLPDRTHVRLFTFATDNAVPTWDVQADEPFTDTGWRAAPRDALDVLVPGDPAPQLWIGGLLRGDGAETPRLDQMKLAWGRRTYLPHLPAIYSRDDEARDLLERFLSLQETVLGGIESEIADLPLLFDAASSPDGTDPSWLSWLFGWLAFERSEAWSEPDARAYLSEAFPLYGRRGTVGALLRYLRIYAGVDARIEEPLQGARVWSLGDTSTLGFDSMLAFEPPDGAVLGESAVVDGSHMMGAAAPAMPLFSDLAHRFCVRVHCGELRPGALEAARMVIEREKPAHTEAHLCVVQPRLRVGVQARVGIDAVVGASPRARLGEPLGAAVLAGAAELCEKEEEEPTWHRP